MLGVPGAAGFAADGSAGTLVWALAWTGGAVASTAPVGAVASTAPAGAVASTGPGAGAGTAGAVTLGEAMSSGLGVTCTFDLTSFITSRVCDSQSALKQI